MKSDMYSLFPTIYDRILEIENLADAGDAQFNEYFLHMDDARKNQFVLTADVRGIELFERIYEIMADPSTEDLEFRRQRILNRMRMKIPFTFRFLLQRLDDLIGPGKYKAWLGRGDWNSRLGSLALGREAFRDPEYTLFIETTTEDVNWYHEVQVFVNKIKPANIIYALSPLVAQGIMLAETVEVAPRTWSYRLGMWKLGGSPFLKAQSEQSTEWNYALGKWKLGREAFGRGLTWEVVKLPETPSIQPTFLEGHARYTASEVVAVRLNGLYTITDLLKTINGSDVTIQYVVTPALGIKEITQIELLRSSANETATEWNYKLGHWELGSKPFGNGSSLILDRVAVYVPVPVADQLTFKHTISHKEGISNG